MPSLSQLPDRTQNFLPSSAASNTKFWWIFFPSLYISPRSARRGIEGRTAFSPKFIEEKVRQTIFLPCQVELLLEMLELPTQRMLVTVDAQQLEIEWFWRNLICPNIALGFVLKREEWSKWRGSSFASTGTGEFTRIAARHANRKVNRPRKILSIVLFVRLSTLVNLTESLPLNCCHRWLSAYLVEELSHPSLVWADQVFGNCDENFVILESMKWILGPVSNQASKQICS